MGIRLVTSIVGVALLVAILYFLPTWVLGITFCVLSAISAYELLGNTGKLKGHPLLWVCVIAAGLVPYCTAYHPFKGAELLVLFGFGFVAFVLGIFDYQRVTFEKLAMAFMGAFVLPYFMASLMRIYMSAGELGKYYVLMPCIAAWGSDIMAYVTGRLCGKHKLAPHVSPKKTIEGAIGGLLGAAVGLCIFGTVMNNNYGVGLSMVTLFISGILGGAAGQLGDLSMSLIKRNVGIKDYGKLFPGHGGVLDRFDSILFTAPIFELYLIATQIIK